MTSVQDWFGARLKASGFQQTFPLYAYILGRFELRDSTKTNVMAVSGRDGNPVLHINRAFFGESSAYFNGVLLHEIHHVVLGHLSDPRFRVAKDRQAMSIAMELSANEGIQQLLPGNPLRIEQFSHLGVEAAQTTWERYELLVASMKVESVHYAQALLDEHGCASIVSATNNKGSAQTGAIDTLIIADLLGSIHDISDRQGIKVRIAGRTPGQLLVSLTEIRPSTIASVDWKTQLRLFATSYRGHTYTYARPSRRFTNRLDGVPGRTRRHEDDCGRLLAVVDTSSSMNQATVSEIFAELTMLRRHVQLVVVECDTVIQRVYPVSEFSSTIRGRGGTDLRPPFDPGFLRKHGATGIVYFTDGAGPYPEHAPRVQTLWVLTSDESFACPWGKKIRMKGRLEKSAFQPSNRRVTAISRFNQVSNGIAIEDRRILRPPNFH